MNVKNTQFPLRDLPGASSVKKTFVMLVTMLLCCLTAQAQKLTVESLEYVPNDAAAASYETHMQDINGNYAGIVKVHIALDGVQFEGGGVLKQEKRSINEYWVWMAQGSNRLKVLHPSFLPLEVNFRMYEGVNIVKSKLTYKLVITVPVAGAVQQQDDGKCYLPFIVEPQSATVLVDGQQQNVENGEAIAWVTKGSHRYEVSATGYVSQEGTVTASANMKPLIIKLKSKQASLQVKSAMSGVQIYVNNQPRGQAPLTLNMFPGSYRLEARLDGYRTHQQYITVADNESRDINIPALERLTGTVMVSYRPIGSDVYVDGQKVGTSPGTFRSIGIGSHKVEIRKEGYVSVSQTVTVKENATSELSGTLTGSNRTFTVKGVSFNMVYVEGGTFTMGATSEQGSETDSYEKPTHSVTLSSYYIGETEVTQALWEAVMGTNIRQQRDKAYKEWRISGEGANYPMYYITWNECQEFVRRLNSLTGQQFHLPTEAQWEYAARGGKKSRGYKYSGSNILDNVAWYDGNTFDEGPNDPDYGIHPVKTKSPNELGIYDMSGNVMEWCQDWFGDYSSSAQTNPTGPSSGSDRVQRGGDDGTYEWGCRLSSRFRENPSHPSPSGLRLAL